jgi:hypothetical protein
MLKNGSNAVRTSVGTPSLPSDANKKLLIAIPQRLHLPASAKLTRVPIPSLHEAALAELKADSAMRAEQLE